MAICFQLSRTFLPNSPQLVRRRICTPVVRRSMRAGVEDRWHRPPRRGEQPPWRSDNPVTGTGAWCTDPRHAPPGTFVTTARHGTGRRWLARWVDNESNERSKAFARKAEAQNHIAAITAALNTGTYADPKQGAITFAEMADEWMAAKETSLKPSTAGGYRSLLAITLKPRWGAVQLADIRHADVQQWVTWLTSDAGAPGSPKPPKTRVSRLPYRRRGQSTPPESSSRCSTMRCVMAA
jgi:Phage integrase, N-terminal SAM-like domain